MVVAVGTVAFTAPTIQNEEPLHWFDAETNTYEGLMTISEADCGGAALDCRYGYSDIENGQPVGPLKETVKKNP